MMNKAIVLFSGGQDSTVCLYWAKKYYKDVLALNINYGQVHAVECTAAKKIAEMAKVFIEVVNIPRGVVCGGSILDGAIKHINPNIAASWVPLRNQLFLTIAFNRAIVYRADAIITGVNAIDYSGYPDCREEFIDSFSKTSFLASEIFIPIETPLIDMSKKEIVIAGKRLEGCMEALAYSHTCYKGEVPPCGECPACILRAKGFVEASVKDPLIERLRSA
jgi:7-cyano-7-deazaguanine synthase